MGKAILVLAFINQAGVLMEPPLPEQPMDAAVCEYRKAHASELFLPKAQFRNPLIAQVVAVCASFVGADGYSGVGK